MDFPQKPESMREHGLWRQQCRPCLIGTIALRQITRKGLVTATDACVPGVGDIDGEKLIGEHAANATSMAF